MPSSSSWTTASPAFFVLSEVILCATGGEALYADMGHLGRSPIIRAWYFVFVALVINYLGQGAYRAAAMHEKNILFGMVQWEAPSTSTSPSSS